MVQHDNDNLRKLDALIEGEIADLQHRLLGKFDHTVVMAINQLYELRNNIRLGFAVDVDTTIRTLDADTAPFIEEVVNTAIRQHKQLGM